MFKAVFELITEPLGLPIPWYYEWIILYIVGKIAYVIAYTKVGILYHTDIISGKTLGSFFHWIIRLFYWIVIWAIIYGAIWIGKFVLAHKAEVTIGIRTVITVICLVKVVMWRIKVQKRNKRGETA